MLNKNYIDRKILFSFIDTYIERIKYDSEKVNDIADYYEWGLHTFTLALVFIAATYISHIVYSLQENVPIILVIILGLLIGIFIHLKIKRYLLERE